MAGEGSKSQTIVIKRIKKGGHGHHGGAWKIAYADFVTAMMAFFLLMWLLSATTEEEKEKLQVYFSQPLEVALFGNSGAGSASVFEGSGGTSNESPNRDTASEAARMQLAASLRSDRERADFARLERLKQKVENAMMSDPALEESLDQLKLDITGEGLRIQIFDEAGRSMFDSGGSAPRPQMRALLQQLGAVLAQVPNRISLEGHTDAVPFTGGAKGYTNWELSSDRANASRRELVAGGLPADHVMRVQGLASTELLDAEDRENPANRRIVIVVMSLEAEDEFLRNAARAAKLVDASPNARADDAERASSAESAGSAGGSDAGAPHGGAEHAAAPHDPAPTAH